MSKSKSSDCDLKLSDRTTLNLLVALEWEENVSQRSLAERLGVALGLTNTLLKRAIRKGLVKVSQAPAKRYAYYVTPKGFGEKSRLVADYLTSSLDFFRVARSQYVEIFKSIQNSGGEHVFLWGAGDLAEIASLSAQEVGVDIAGIIAPGANVSEHHGLPVYPDAACIKGQKTVAVVLSDSEKPQQAYEDVLSDIEDCRVFAPDFMHISRKKAGDE